MGKGGVTLFVVNNGLLVNFHGDELHCNHSAELACELAQYIKKNSDAMLQKYFSDQILLSVM